MSKHAHTKILFIVTLCMKEDNFLNVVLVWCCELAVCEQKEESFHVFHVFFHLILMH